MKKITTILALFATVSIMTTGCLKDKGFENHTYGINDPDTQPPGVGFPQAASAKVTIGLDAGATTPQVVNDLVYVNLESGTPAASDITITLQFNDALRTAYNTANNTNILLLNPALYSLGSMTLVIPAGSRGVQVPLNIASTTSLDPNSTYGVGITISSVSNGLVIASNLQNLLVEFTIKNKYDGRYNLKGYHNRPTLDLPYNETVYMITTGANSVTMFWPALGQYAHPLNGGATYYGSFTTNFKFNLSTNAFIGWDLTPYANTVTNDIFPASNSRYDPATKTIYANYGYNGNSQRVFFDTLKYLGPR